MGSVGADDFTLSGGMTLKIIQALDVYLSLLALERNWSEDKETLLPTSVGDMRFSSKREVSNMLKGYEGNLRGLVNVLAY